MDPRVFVGAFLFLAAFTGQPNLRDQVLQVDEVVRRTAQRVTDRHRSDLDGRDHRYHTPLSLQGLSSVH